jgi:hypothetical protein
MRQFLLNSLHIAGTSRFSRTLQIGCARELKILIDSSTV